MYDTGYAVPPSEYNIILPVCIILSDTVCTISTPAAQNSLLPPTPPTSHTPHPHSFFFVLKKMSTPKSSSSSSF